MVDLRGHEKDLAFAPKDVGNHWKLLRNGVIRCIHLVELPVCLAFSLSGYF